MSLNRDSFYKGVYRWILRSDYIRSAVLFGSAPRQKLNESNGRLEAIDWDIHIITCKRKPLDSVDWPSEITDAKFCMDASRAASGGVRKWTIVFREGQIDLVAVPELLMRLATIGYSLGLHRRAGRLRAALNEMATCLHGGYMFLKGEECWGRFYRHVSQLPGVRLSDSEVGDLAFATLCDGLWVLQKLSLGEVIAAQHVLHSRLVDANLRLWREFRLRESLPLPSFGLGRKIETLVDEQERTLLRVSSLANVECLESSTRVALSGLVELVGRLIPGWKVPPSMAKLLEEAGPSSRHP